MNHPADNTDPEEVARFEGMAARWWDPEGDMQPLHAINPVRTDFIESRSEGLDGKTVLDVGCGGGLLSEAMASRGANVTGIDAADKALRVARLHATESGVAVNYEAATAERWADEHAGEYDVVTCLEMLEHVPEPASVVAACARLVRPGGHVFFSTLNRTPAAFGLAIVGAEYLLGLLPRGTHRYEKLIRPSELARWSRTAGLATAETRGLYYNPLTKSARLGDRPDVNYIVHARRPESAS